MAPEVHSERETVEPVVSAEAVSAEAAVDSDRDGDVGAVGEDAGPDLWSGSGAPGAADVHSDHSDIEVGPELVEPDSGEAAASESEAADDPETTDEATPVVETEAEAEVAPPGRRRLAVLLSVAAFALALDITSKLLVVAKLSDHDPVRLPTGILWLHLTRNPGAAFSIGEGQTWVFTIIAVAVAVVILRLSRNLRSLPWACALGLLLGGALGNLGDRIFRSPGLFRGHVVDVLQFPQFPVINWDFPVFNLADSSIVVGGCLMVLLSFLGIQPDGTRHERD